MLQVEARLALQFRYSNRCQRCGGYLLIEGREVHCLNCGWYSPGQESPPMHKRPGSYRRRYRKW